MHRTIQRIEEDLCDGLGIVQSLKNSGEYPAVCEPDSFSHTKPISDAITFDNSYDQLLDKSFQSETSILDAASPSADLPPAITRRRSSLADMLSLLTVKRDQRKTPEARSKTSSYDVLNTSMASIGIPRNTSRQPLSESKLRSKSSNLDPAKTKKKSTKRQLFKSLSLTFKTKSSQSIGSLNESDSDTGEDINGACRDIRPCAHFNPFQVTEGVHNVLFHFIGLNTGRGTFLSLPRSDGMDTELNRLVLKNFHRCCSCIHEMLSYASVVESTSFSKPVECSVKFTLITPCEYEEVAPEKTESAWSKFSLRKRRSSLKHKPSHFVYDEKHLTYWVTGRKFSSPSPQELYICHHDSIPQDIAEVGFRILFGTSL